MPRYPAISWGRDPTAEVRETLDLTGRACGLSGCAGRIIRETLMPGEFICDTCQSHFRTDGVFFPADRAIK